MELAYRYEQGQWILIYEQEYLAQLSQSVYHSSEGIIYSLTDGETLAFFPETGWTFQRPRTFPANFSIGKAAYFSRFGMIAILAWNEFFYRKLETWLWDGQAYYLIDDSFDEFYDFQFEEEMGVVDDPAASRLLMFSWQGGSLHVWANQGSTWEHVDITPPLPPRLFSLNACVFPPHNSVIIYGSSRNNSGIHSPETWEFRGAEWYKVETAKIPSPRKYSGMTYDPRSKTILLYGGEDINQYRCLNETWKFDGREWQQIYTAAAPQFRSSLIMAFHEAGSRLSVSGGHCGDDTFTDFWEFGGSNWVQRDVTGPKIARFNAAAAYDPGRQVLVVAGGTSGSANHSSVLELTYHPDLGGN